MTITSTAPIITAAGISAPVFNDIFSYFISNAQAIYPSLDLSPGSFWYQLFAVIASSQNDTNSALIKCFSTLSPSYATGVALDNQVKLNGIARLIPTNSTADVVLIGQTGQPVNNGIVSDGVNQYSIPNIIFPLSGTITVLATALKSGAISSPANSITQIITPTLGWQSVNNPSASILGAPVETDAELRLRQTKSTSLSALSPVEVLIAAIANISGIQLSAVYNNPTNSIDTTGSISGAVGLTQHSIAIVTLGGDPLLIASAIAGTKNPGTGTFGSISEVVSVGNTSETIYFSQAIQEIVTATITIKTKTNYNSTYGTVCIQNFVDYINNLQIGQGIEFAEYFAACVNPYFKLESFAVKINGGSAITNTDIAGIWNGVYVSEISGITLVLA